MHARALPILLAALLLAAPPAAAQDSAVLREILRVVKTVRAGATRLTDAKVNTTLGNGDRLRTGGRSAAGVRFPDRSTLRVGELSEVVITGVRGRDAEIVRGKAFADYRNPSALRTGSAVAAIRGTKVELRHDEKGGTTRVRCYGGRVYVASSRNPILAGATITVTARTLTDPALVGNSGAWTGGEIRFTDGPYRGQARLITGFDNASGTVTFQPALDQADMAGIAGADNLHGYLLLKNPNAPFVVLGRNQGTTVRRDGDPDDPYPIPGIEFAGLDRRPWWESLVDGAAVYAYPGFPDHVDDKERNWHERDAIAAATTPQFEIVCGCKKIPESHPARLHNALHGAFARSAAGHQATRLAAAGVPRGGLEGTTPESRSLPSAVTETGFALGRENQQFRFEPFAFGTDRADGDSVGARMRYQASQGQFYAELGYRYLNLDGTSFHDLSEAFVHHRSRHGDLIAGRQHLFLGPANNNDIGRLLGLESSDAVVYELPLRRGYRQQVGYVIDTRAVKPNDEGFDAFYARGQAPFLRGNVGYSAMVEPDRNRNIGWQVDAAQTLLRNVLDAYGEYGRDTTDKDIYTAGLYLAWLYHKLNVDLFAEYARRSELDERFTLRLRRDVGNGLLLILFFDRELDLGRSTVGGGVLWSKRFR